MAMSMGSLGEGADIWMVGVKMGMVRADRCSSSPLARREGRRKLSVAVAICAAKEKKKRERGRHPLAREILAYSLHGGKRRRLCLSSGVFPVPKTGGRPG